MSALKNGQDGEAKDGVGGSFPDVLDSPGEPSTQTTTVSDDVSSSPPPIPPRSFARKPTPRPHLFPSLQEAHSHVYRIQSKQSSRDASGDTTQGRVGEESDEEDMTPLTSAFGRSLTTSAQPSLALAESRESPALPEHSSSPATHGFMNVALPVFEPINWDNVPKPLNTSRTTSSGAESTNKLPAAGPTNPPHVSGSSVDRIIDQYAHQSSSPAQLHGAVYGSISDVEHFSHQHGSGTEDVLGVVSTQAQEQGGVGALASYTAAHRGNYNFLKAAHMNTPPPQVPLPADPPCRPSTPFFRPDTPRPTTGGPVPSVHYATVRRPLSVSDGSSGDQDKENEADNKFDRYQETQGHDPGLMESATASDAESRVAQLTAPPQRMHSARRARYAHRSMQSTVPSSPGDCVSESSNEDPFVYEGMLFHPSKERAVSACLRKVSGLQRESRASIYSQDGTPSKTFGHHNEVFGDVVSPGAQRAIDHSRLHMPSYRHGNVPRGAGDDQAIEYEVGDFYNPEAIESDWAVENPNEVKVPVNNNLFGGAQRNLTEASGPPRSENQLAWEQLRRREEQQAHRLTGNTDD